MVYMGSLRCCLELFARLRFLQSSPNDKYMRAYVLSDGAGATIDTNGPAVYINVCVLAETNFAKSETGQDGREDLSYIAKQKVVKSIISHPLPPYLSLPVSVSMEKEFIC